MELQGILGWSGRWESDLHPPKFSLSGLLDDFRTLDWVRAYRYPAGALAQVDELLSLGGTAHAVATD